MQRFKLESIIQLALLKSLLTQWTGYIVINLPPSLFPQMPQRTHHRAQICVGHGWRTHRTHTFAKCPHLTQRFGRIYVEYGFRARKLKFVHSERCFVNDVSFTILKNIFRIWFFLLQLLKKTLKLCLETANETSTIKRDMVLSYQNVERKQTPLFYIA